MAVLDSTFKRTVQGIGRSDVSEYSELHVRQVPIVQSRGNFPAPVTSRSFLADCANRSGSRIKISPSLYVIRAARPSKGDALCVDGVAAHLKRRGGEALIFSRPGAVRPARRFERENGSASVNGGGIWLPERNSGARKSLKDSFGLLLARQGHFHDHTQRTNITAVRRKNTAAKEPVVKAHVSDSAW